MTALKILASNETFTWTPEGARTRNSFEAQTKAEAQRRFEQHVADRGTALKKVGDTYKNTTEFDTEADELVLLPKVAGG